MVPDEMLVSVLNTEVHKIASVDCSKVFSVDLLLTFKILSLARILNVTQYDEVMK